MSGQTLVLLGDSILDNGPYTMPEPDTTAHLERLLHPHWSVHRVAQDGATLGDMPVQLDKLASDCTTAVLSISGNDATKHIGVLDERVSSSRQVLEKLLMIAEEFGQHYETVARTVAKRAGRTLLCTIYEAPLEPPIYARFARVPLALLNDRIVRTGARLGLDVLELRSVCTEPSDFVEQIEPSPQGAAKIATAIAAVLNGERSLKSGRVFATNPVKDNPANVMS